MIPESAAVVETCFRLPILSQVRNLRLIRRSPSLVGSRVSLMIADTALLSSSPIILIDGFENAGIDGGGDQLLVGNEKIVLMPTHDPLPTLRADKRCHQKRRHRKSD